MRNKLCTAALLAVLLSGLVGCAATSRPAFEDPPANADAVGEFARKFHRIAWGHSRFEKQKDPRLYTSAYIWRIALNDEYQDFIVYQDRFFRALELIYPKYKENMTTVRTKLGTAAVITFPKDQCGAKIEIFTKAGRANVSSVDFKVQRNSTGRCEKETEKAQYIYRELNNLKHCSFKDSLGFIENVPRCSEVPQSHLVRGHPVNDCTPAEDGPQGWYEYNSDYCIYRDAKIIHYAWQTKKQRSGNAAAARRAREYEAYQARKRAADPLYDFTVTGPDGKKMYCGRENKNEEVSCRPASPF
jgi:hypothetical protein